MDLAVTFPTAHHVEPGVGRIMVADSLSFFEHEPWIEDVVLGASFAGRPTGAMAMRHGVRAWIAHQGGPGKDKAGSEGLRLADTVGVPAAAIATMSARLSDGKSLLHGQVAEVNDAAAALGVTTSDTGESAAHKLLGAPVGTAHDFGAQIDESIHEVPTEWGSIAVVWSFSRVPSDSKWPVYCVASHGAPTMAYYALRVKPRGGLICNDAGIALDRSGVAGLPIMDDAGIAAAAVSTDTARIGDAMSTIEDGQLSAVNDHAFRIGARVGTSARQAAELMLRAAYGRTDS